MSEPASEFTVNVDQVADYEFRVSFNSDELSSITVDEGPPIGKNAGPSPSRLLAAAIGHCLQSSLLFCAQKSRVDVKHLRGEVKVQIVRNESRRLRIGKVEVTIHPDIAEQDRERARRCLDLFQDFCTVTESIRDGIPVDVKIENSSD
jgi:uncharacterized OsmC-like protein